MNDPEGGDDPGRLQPRPSFLAGLRDAVRREVGVGSDAVPWVAGGIDPEAEDARRRLPSIRGIEIQREIGRGGMGTVYLARQIGLDRPVALKLVWLGRGGSAGNLLALAQGPRAIARLSHPNVVQVFQVGKQDGWAYGVFEYLEGGDLKGALKDGPWPAERAAALLRTLAETVGFIHRRGIVHRDLKCSNVLLSAEGVPKIADFGLVKILGSEDPRDRESDGLRGTPHAMAPEQAAGPGSEVGPAADIHALGVILYELLTGRPPFLGSTREETLRRVVETVPEPPSRLRAGISPELDAVCLRCLQKDPARRHADADAMAAELSRYLDRAAGSGATGPPVR